MKISPPSCVVDPVRHRPMWRELKMGGIAKMKGIEDPNFNRDAYVRRRIFKRPVSFSLCFSPRGGAHFHGGVSPMAPSNSLAKERKNVTQRYCGE